VAATSAEAEAGVRRTIASYGPLCDDGRFAEWADLFTPDARMRVMGRTYQGRDAVRAFIERGQPPERRGKHLCAAPVIEIDDSGRTARAWVDFVFVDRHRAITSVGRYHDELELGDDGRWRFTWREIVFLGDQPEQTGPPPG